MYFHYYRPEAYGLIVLCGRACAIKRENSRAEKWAVKADVIEYYHYLNNETIVADPTVNKTNIKYDPCLLERAPMTRFFELYVRIYKMADEMM